MSHVCEKLKIIMNGSKVMCHIESKPSEFLHSQTLFPCVKKNFFNIYILNSVKVLKVTFH